MGKLEQLVVEFTVVGDSVRDQRETARKIAVAASTVLEHSYRQTDVAGGSLAWKKDAQGYVRCWLGDGRC